MPIDDLHRVHVLAVDDDADALRFVDVLLRAAGAWVQTAGTAEDAPRQIAVAPPDVLVSDLGLPHVDGCALIA